MSTMATTGNEVAVGYRWLLGVLRGDATMQGMVTGSFADLAPQGQTPPYNEVAFLAGSVEAADAGAAEIMCSLRFQVKTIVAGFDVTPAALVAARIHLLLQRQQGVLVGGTSPGSVLSCVRGLLVSYTEGQPEAAFRHHGHEYVLEVQSS